MFCPEGHYESRSELGRGEASKMKVKIFPTPEKFKIWIDETLSGTHEKTWGSGAGRKNRCLNTYGWALRMGWG